MGRHSRRSTLPSLLAWAGAGLGVGVVAGLALGERLHHQELGPAAPPRPAPRPHRLGAAAAARAANNVLEADATVGGEGIRAVGVSAGMVELAGWVASRTARARAARLVAAVPGIDAVINRLLVRGEDDLNGPDLRLADQSA